MSEISVNSILDASGGATTTINGLTPTVSNMAGRNRIINGDMRIDQRNAGASVTPTSSAYTLDRWYAFIDASSKFSVQQSSTAPAGFTNSMLVTSLSSYTVGSGEAFGIRQFIEGFNIADLGWGTASAQTVTLSFWVRSSLTGTFGGVIRNSANNRTYPFTYSISAANTFEQKTLTIAGDTSGTWLTTNSAGIGVAFGLGVDSSISGTAGAWSGTGNWGATGATSLVGTSGATFYITGVQLEAGSVATPFEHRMYGQELALCMRYYEVINDFQQQETNAYASYRYLSATRFKVQKRVTPTSTVTMTYGWPAGAGASNLGADQNNKDFLAAVDYNSANQLYNFIVRASAEL